MKRQRDDARRRGATLVLVTTIGVIIAILAVSMIELGYDARVLAARDVEKVDARCAADAGLVEAFYKMQCALVANWGDWDDAEDLPAGGTGTVDLSTTAQYSYQISVINSDLVYQIDSTGTYRMASKTVHALIGVGSYWDGIGLGEDLLAMNSAQFGLYPVGAPGGMNIRSNTIGANTMRFMNNARVAGDVYCGPGGDPLDVIETKDTITQTIAGEIGASSEKLIWPPVSVPEGLAVQSATPVTLNSSTTLPAGAQYAYYDDLKLGAGTVLTVSGATTIYVKGTLDLGQSGQIVLTPGATLNLYIGEALICGNSADIRGTSIGDRPTVQIYGLSGPAPTPTCTSIIIKTKSNVSVGVYAPEADVRIHNGNTTDEAFVGALIANSLQIDMGADFLFDTRFAHRDIDDILAQFVISRWWED
jgi:hypothetical protein